MNVADGRLERYAELAVRVGANVEEGQIVEVMGLVEHAPLVRALTRAAYAAGARYVDARYGDQHVRRALIERASDDMLEWSPPWRVTELEYLAGERAASIGVTGDPEPDLLSDLDGRESRARIPARSPSSVSASS